ncbi:MAG: helix-turn-helix domain-containing protein, partial [Erysipelotrichaceae bacterium]|nr:helix-turn-helix domain-containing protein [Erysipelotrichaceae bacterium]
VYSALNRQINTNSLYLYCQLDGQSRIRIHDEETDLQKDSILAVNPNERHQILAENGILVQLEIDPAVLFLDDDQGQKYIICTPEQEGTENIKHLQTLIRRFLLHPQKTTVDQLQRERIGYELVIFLLSYFSTNSRYESHQASRQNQILRYIQLNYQSDLSLDSIANAVGLSSAYFSKYFKETFGQTFVKYLSEFRAVSSVSLLESSDLSILEIALQSGFANLNAYNEAFKRKFKTTPGSWRKKQKEQNREVCIPLESVGDYLKNEQLNTPDHAIQVSCSFKAESEPLDRYWFKLINIGSVKTMQREKNQRFLKEICSSLPFENGRLLLDLSDRDPFFDQEEEVLDLLQNLSLAPWIVLDYREAVAFDPNLERFRAFLIYFSNRYGIDNLKSWTFELYFNSDFMEKEAELYDSCCRLANQYLSQANLTSRVVGPGLQIDQNGQNLKMFCQQNTQIDQLTVTLSPLVFNRKDGDVYMERQTSPDSFLADLRKIQKIAGENGIEEVFPVSWIDSLYDKDVLNDTCFRAARIAQVYLKAYGITPALPVSAPFDLSSTSSGIFSKDAGLLSPKDIRKPSFNVYSFLKHLDEDLNYHDEHMIITSSKKKYVQIVLQNCPRLGYIYFLHENQQDEYEINEYFDHPMPQEFQIKLTGLEKGLYVVKEKRINETNGNAFAKYKEINYGDASFFGPREMRFLQAASIPGITGYQVFSEDGSLVLKGTLEPNEVRHLHIVFARSVNV